MEQRDQLRRLFGRIFIGQPRDETAQEPQRVLGSLGLTAEPEQIVGHAARRVRRAPFASNLDG